MGLEELARLNKDTGLAAGYSSGLTSGAGLAQTLANTAQTRAQTDRYTAETPDYLKQQGYATEKARLGNLQGAADEAAGVFGAKAEQSTAEAHQKAQEAQQAWQRLPEEHKAKFLTAIQQKQTELLDTIEQTLTQTSDVPQTIALIESSYPEVTKDKSWTMMKQQYGKMPPQQALNEIRKMKASLASSAAYGDPKVQGSMIEEDQKQAGRLELQGLQNQGAAAVAGIKDTTKSLTNAELMNKWITVYNNSPKGSPEREEARVILNMMRGGNTQTKDSLFGPQEISKDPLEADKPPTKTIPKEALTYLLNNPGTAADFEQHFGIQKGWAEKYIQEHKRK